MRGLRWPRAALTGALTAFDASDSSDIRLTLSGDLPQDGVAGKTIIFANTARSDASYRIDKRVDGHTISLGSASLDERFVDTTDYSKGMITTIMPGETYRIHQSGQWNR